MSTDRTYTSPDTAHCFEPTDRDLLEESPSAGWKEVADTLGVDTGVEPPDDALAAARRSDRPRRYRRKHLMGVTS